MDSQAVRRAQVKLELRDIALHTSSLKRNPDEEPLLYPARIRQQSEVKVSVDRVSLLDDGDDPVRILRAYVQLLALAFEGGDKTRKEPALFSICAVYRVDYVEKKELTGMELDAFTQFNAVHDVWPFWRQHVYETVSKAGLPRITIPFFRAFPTQSTRRGAAA